MRVGFAASLRRCSIFDSPEHEASSVTRPASVPPDFCYPRGTVSADQALAFILDRARVPAGTEAVALGRSLGRVLARPVCSPIDVPGHDNSQMDGYAVSTVELGEAGGEFPVSQRIAAGQTGAPLAPGSVARIFTGAPMPPGADAVVMQERAEVLGQRVRLPGGILPGDNVRPAGNDVRCGDRVMEAGTRLAPRHVGALASLGMPEVLVTPRLRVAILASGDELRQPGEPLLPGQIYNSNRYTLQCLLSQLGAEVVDLGQVADDAAATCEALLTAAGSADVVVSSGGMSVGEEDHVKLALESVGRLELWRVAVRPGKPLAYGRIDDADFLGLPGNPVSTLVTFCLFVRPFLLRRMGCADLEVPRWPAKADFVWPAPRLRREFARARVRFDDDGVPWVSLHARQGSDVMSSTTWADGLVEIMEGTTVAHGDTVRFIDFVRLTE
jgi:molybdopterin molybdotransferase